ncbi:MAG: hypothetical protein JRN51_08625 [Nitrososphaerota archaeon]|nr:hypothetical protein [Nitrososphaerota archaeon]MDG6967349.1 hypothetical protein [Nitrososphaerota archaeon]MDG6978427.1 hypothetical protein [Nitrososphaerota archaeon]MDG6981156.1 hypothetical protein [Nitrososphaerota archaeon]
MKFGLDVDYVAFAVLMGVFGIVGITATAHVSPNVLAAVTCNCIPGPAARLQELSVVFLAIGLVLAPIGLLRKATIRAPSPADEAGASGGAGIPPMRSPGVFFLGVALVVFGVALVIAPSFLVLKNTLLIGEGAGMVVLGALFGYTGGRTRQVV